MKKINLSMIISAVLTLFMLTACDKLNVLVIPEQGDYFAGKISYSDWAGRGGAITMLDRDGNNKVCKGKYKMVNNALTCYGKKFQAQVFCTNGRTADIDFTTSSSCTEAYGSVVDDLGNEYEIFIGLSDKLMESKINTHKGNSLNNVSTHPIHADSPRNMNEMK